jgi:hypothetical protein
LSFISKLRAFGANVFFRTDDEEYLVPLVMHAFHSLKDHSLDTARSR